MEPHIIFENDSVCIIDKPSGVSVHQDGMRVESTVADWFVTQYPTAAEVGEPLVLSNGNTVHRPGIVHRLDKETSGVMVLAKTHDAFLALKEQFQTRQVKKQYRAFVWGAIKEDGGVIDKPIGRSRSDFRRRSAEFGAKPPLRDARTVFSVLRRSPQFSYVEVEPETGRMHQIRVHFKARGNPVVCDTLYLPRRECALGFSRLALHAYSLTIHMPGADTQTFVAELPPDFLAAETIMSQGIA